MISGVIFQSLRSLVDNRVYPSTFPQTPTWPAIRYTIRREAAIVLCGTDLGQTDDSRVQIDVVAQSYAATVALRDQVIAALDDVSPPCTREFEAETYDTETKTHRVILEFSFYPSSP
jgi:uncharacterized protein DUF3168